MHMAYNVTMVDRRGHLMTLYLCPDHAPEVRNVPFATNHQRRVEMAHHAAFTRSVEREHYLTMRLGWDTRTMEEVADDFLQPPLYATNYSKGFGTIYTSIYRPSNDGQASDGLRGSVVRPAAVAGRLVKEPGASLGLVDPGFDEACGRDIVVIVADAVNLAQDHRLDEAGRRRAPHGLRPATAAPHGTTVTGWGASLTSFCETLPSSNSAERGRGRVCRRRRRPRLFPQRCRRSSARRRRCATPTGSMRRQELRARSLAFVNICAERDSSSSLSHVC